VRLISNAHTLDGQVVFITGSGRRIGAQIARDLAAAGAAVLVHVNSSIEQGREVVSEITKRGGVASLIIGDLSTVEGCEEIVNAVFSDPMVEEFGGIDLLVNNASVFVEQRLENMDHELLQKMFAIHAQAPALLTKGLLPSLRMRKGSVVNMVDNSYDRPWSGYSGYCASKAALVNLTKSLSLELAPSVRINAIAPGAILPAAHEEEIMDEIAAQIPMKKWGSPSDISEAVMYLASANYITGQIITVDGGWSLTR
jgi:pteridine reductase